MRSCWWLLVTILTFCHYTSVLPYQTSALTDKGYKEVFKKFRKEENGQSQVCLLMNFLERYELFYGCFSYEDFAKCDFVHKFARVKQILLKLDMISDDAIVQEVGDNVQADQEDSLRQKYSIPRIDSSWKYYRWHVQIHCIKSVQNSVIYSETNEPSLPKEAIGWGGVFLGCFEDDRQWEKARQHVEASFPQVRKQLTAVIDRFFDFFVSALEYGGNADHRICHFNIKSYLTLVNLWPGDDDEAADQVWTGLLWDILGRQSSFAPSTFPEMVQLPSELSILFDDDTNVVFKKFLEKYTTEFDESFTVKPIYKAMESFLGKTRLMVLRDVFLHLLDLKDPKFNSRKNQTVNCNMPSCFVYMVVPATAIAFLSYNKLVHGQFFPYWQDGVTTIRRNSTTLVTVAPVSSGWTKWQVALVVVVAVITVLAIALALIYYYWKGFLKATSGAHSGMSSKDASGTTRSTSTSATSSDNKSCSKSTKK